MKVRNNVPDAAPPGTTPLDIARSYTKRGWAVIPIPDRSKKPLEENWPNLRITTETAPQFFNGQPQNIGVILGAASGGLVDTDLDDPLAVQLAPHFLPATDAVFGRKGNPNSHYLYAVTDGAGPRETYEDGGMLVEYRGDGGWQTVFPGSRHKETGEAITWTKDGMPARVLRGPLQRAVAALAAATLIAKRWTEGARDELCAAVVGSMLRAGAPEQAVTQFIAAVCSVTGDEERQHRLGQVTRFARALDSDAGTKKVPGWPKFIKLTDRETVQKFRRWLGLADDIDPFPLKLVHSVSEFVALQIPPREPILDGLLLTKSIAEVFSKRGVGKTFFTLSLCMCIARGTGKFLEWPVHKARRVLFVDGEMSGAELQERVRRFVGASIPQNLDILASDTFYQLFQTSMNLADPRQQLQFLGLLDELEAQGRLPEVVALDNKSALTFGTETNSETEQQGFVNFLKGMRHRGMTAILVHHAGKSGDQRGSSALEDPFDLVIKLEAPKEGEDEGGSGAEGAEFVVSFTKHRGTKKPSPYTLGVELVEDLGGTLDWAITRPPSKGNLLRVLGYLYDNPATTTQAEVARALRIDKSNLSDLVNTKLRAREFLARDSLTLTASARAYVEAARRANKRGADGEAGVPW